MAISGLTLTGTDQGNYSLTQPSTTASITAWSVSGFHAPVGINNSYAGTPPLVPALWNTIKGGQAVPLKFNLFAAAGGTELVNVTDVLGFSLAALTCSTGAEDPVEPDFITTGATVLRYSGGQFIQNWDTPKGASKCYRVTMTARDGSMVSAFFKTKYRFGGNAGGEARPAGRSLESQQPGHLHDEGPVGRPVPFGRVSCSSVQTRNSSLPGMYSQR